MCLHSKGEFTQHSKLSNQHELIPKSANAAFLLEGHINPQMMLLEE